MRTFAILPVKSFPAAKQRLRESLPPAPREDLVEAMFRDVISSLRTTSVDGILVVTASPTARAIAVAHGAEVLQDRETGHNAAAALGVEAARSRGAERALLVPGDCPALDPSELDELLRREVSIPSVLVVPDRHGTGTNALLLTPPDALASSFGPGSCQRHLELAAAHDVSAEVAEVPSLALDIDTLDDLESLAGVGDRAPETRRLLGQLSAC